MFIFVNLYRRILSNKIHYVKQLKMNCDTLTESSCVLDTYSRFIGMEIIYFCYELRYTSNVSMSVEYGSHFF